MQIGAVYPQAEIGNDPAFIRDFAQAVEGAGFTYITAFDHVLGADASRFDGPIGGFPSAPYLAEHPFHEVLTLFAFLAGVTDRIWFRPRLLLLPQRQTPLVAKQAATVSRLSGGRLKLAVGVGWNPAEYEGMGVDFHTRGDRLDEQLELLRRLWAEPLVNFDGAWHHLDRVGINPLPEGGGIELWIGSGPRERSLRRVAQWADGWIALLTPEEDLGESIGRLRELVAAEGHDAAAFPIETLMGVGDGGPDEWAEQVEQVAALGVTQVCLASGRGRGRTPADHLQRLLDAGKALIG